MLMFLFFLQFMLVFFLGISLGLREVFVMFMMLLRFVGCSANPTRNGRVSAIMVVLRSVSPNSG
jgi:hypothetical protein